MLYFIRIGNGITQNIINYMLLVKDILSYNFHIIVNIFNFKVLSSR